MKPKQGFSWDPAKYEQLVEEAPHPLLKEQEIVEMGYVLGLFDISERTVIDIGAGNGREAVLLAKVAKKIIAIELDQEMCKALRNRVGSNSKIEVIEGNVNNLVELLEEKEVEKPLVICLLNTLGPWIGSREKAVGQMKSLAEKSGGDVIVSLFKQEALREIGLDIYNVLEPLLGEADLDEVDFDKGDFRTKSGYFSHWFTEDERHHIETLLGGTKVAEIDRPHFWILHVSYK